MQNTDDKTAADGQQPASSLQSGITTTVLSDRW